MTKPKIVSGTYTFENEFGTVELFFNDKNINIQSRMAVLANKHIAEGELSKLVLEAVNFAIENRDNG